jgi:DNA replication and repair protein RecF
MYLKSLYLRNFRLYEEAYFEFGPQVNKICGPNAKGKTSLLEAIHFLMTGRSFRTSSVAELIRHGTEFFYLHASFVKNGIEQSLKITCEGIERKVIYNSTTLPSISCLLGILKGVVLSPDDAALVKGAPSIRRQFLDLQIAQIEPLYVHYLTRFNRAMRQRNCLLRAKDLSAVDSWEHEMAHSAAFICKERHRAADSLRHHCGHLHKRMAGDAAELSVIYKSTLPANEEGETIKKSFLGLLHKNRKREMDFGFTLSGPHKDDLLIAIDAKEVRYFASEGQQRLSTSAIKFAEWERLKSLSEGNPLMLIDDVGMSLDESRKKRLLNHTLGLGQVLLTSTESLPLEGRVISMNHLF